ADYVWLTTQATSAFRVERIECVFPVAAGPEGLDDALAAVCAQAERAVDAACSLLILSDHEVGPEWAPVPMLLAVGAVHHHLIRAGKRLRASLICDTGEPREDHHFACLIGYGASLIYPYLAYASVAQMVEREQTEDGRRRTEDEGSADGNGASSVLRLPSSVLSVDQALTNYKAALDKGLLKIMSK